ncbi:hypothetical protein [Rhizobacter sp. Root404]|uniref:phage nozzle protein n=1 Tax=Rhizobacter sp. Root404 TaxID=1736528 RepID=UPI0006F976A4|nr:hypothetical protein [Rhizobacter sp. Root404]KQW36756.1 hypothetical protein ASC76_19155 [Rhizobacter sp. Root404]
MSELVSGGIPSLLNGVSQQTPTYRLPSQAAAQENALSSPVYGLAKRPPTEHIARLDSRQLVKPYIHAINRDNRERSVVVVENGDLKAYDMVTGAPKTVNFQASKDYLKCAFPRDDMTLLQVADNTIVVNKTVAPLMSGEAFASDRSTGTLSIPRDYRASDQKYTYWYSDWANGMAMRESATVYDTFAAAEAALYALLLGHYPDLAAPAAAVVAHDVFPFFAQTTARRFNRVDNVTINPGGTYVVAPNGKVLVGTGTPYVHRTTRLFRDEREASSGHTQGSLANVGWPGALYYSSTAAATIGGTFQTLLSGGQKCGVGVYRKDITTVEWTTLTPSRWAAACLPDCPVGNFDRIRTSFKVFDKAGNFFVGSDERWFPGGTYAVPATGYPAGTSVATMLADMKATVLALYPTVVPVIVGNQLIIDSPIALNRQFYIYSGFYSGALSQPALRWFAGTTEQVLAPTVNEFSNGYAMSTTSLYDAVQIAPPALYSASTMRFTYFTKDATGAWVESDDSYDTFGHAVVALNSAKSLALTLVASSWTVAAVPDVIRSSRLDHSELNGAGVQTQTIGWPGLAATLAGSPDVYIGVFRTDVDLVGSSTMGTPMRSYFWDNATGPVQPDGLAGDGVTYTVSYGTTNVTRTDAAGTTPTTVAGALATSFTAAGVPATAVDSWTRSRSNGAGTFSVTVGSYSRTYPRSTRAPYGLAFTTVDAVGGAVVEGLRKDRLFIVVKAGVAEQTYKVSINGRQASYTAGKSDNAPSYRLDYVAAKLAQQIAGWNLYDVQRFGSFIMVEARTAGSVLYFDYSDTWNNQALYAMKNRVQTFTDLPLNFVPDTPVEVVGEGGAEGYFVRFSRDGEVRKTKYTGDTVGLSGGFLLHTTSFGSDWTALEGQESGQWEECPSLDVFLKFIPELMPHVLVSEADGTFTFKVADWSQRKAGNEVSVPRPSFVGRQIKDVFYHRNRLGFLTESSVSMTKAGEFFDFWPESAKDVLDSDPVDVELATTRVVSLKHAVELNDAMVLMSDGAQFSITSNGVLTPRTANIQQRTAYDSAGNARPANAGKRLFFLHERSGYTSGYEYVSVDNAQNYEANEVTGHVPNYIPGGVWLLKATTGENMAVAVSDQEPTALYVYKFLHGSAEQGKLQESWSRWSFDATVLGLDFNQGLMNIVVQRADGVYLEVVDLQENKVDEPGFRVHLDRKTKVTGVTTGLTTRFVLPYPATLDPVFVSLGGTRLDAVRVDSTTFDVSTTTASALVGFGYRMRYQLSPIYLRNDKGQAQTDAVLKLRNLAVTYASTGEFRSEVTPVFRNTQVKQFAPAGVEEVGQFRFQVMTDAATVKVELVSDGFAPVRLQSILWEGVYVQRARRIN